MIYSFSRLSAFEQCKYAWWMNYMVNIYRCECGKEFNVPKKAKDVTCPECGSKNVKLVNVNKDNAFSLYGGFCHELIEKYAKGELKEYEMLPAYEDEFEIAVTEEFPPNAFADLRESYYNGGYAYFESFDGFGYITDPYKILGVEQNFTTDFGSFQLQGFIDLILEDKDGNIIIVDHKSKKEIKTKADKLHYGRQTALYAKYIYDTYGKWPTELVYNCFRSQTLCRIKFTKSVYDEAVEWATKQVETIENFVKDENAKWEPDLSSDFFCNYLCGYGHCCQFKEALND